MSTETEWKTDGVSYYYSYLVTGTEKVMCYVNLNKKRINHRDLVVYERWPDTVVVMIVKFVGKKNYELGNKWLIP